MRGRRSGSGTLGTTCALCLGGRRSNWLHVSGILIIGYRLIT